MTKTKIFNGVVYTLGEVALSTRLGLQGLAMKIICDFLILMKGDKCDSFYCLMKKYGD